ncbi:hypothetical protein [Aporhodopirellula aestuarii]|uniref:Uncharacterized protein n=1 Tax=Aporhodopirellula aestuarii TaxID=2950107 RepID=A0ABT0U3T2_9BACT|nr:hypothetical protein [Aporhodopirellula aestuarii]MCM2371579.1 hypothetical protein [Aporhodopirellula aestuarii]
MATIFYILVVWAFITALGHGTWLTVQAVYQRLFGVDGSNGETQLGRLAGRLPPSWRPKGQPERPSPVKDIAAFERMVDALTATEEISAETAGELKAKAREFAGLEVASPSSEMVSPPASPAILPAESGAVPTPAKTHAVTASPEPAGDLMTSVSAPPAASVWAGSPGTTQLGAETQTLSDEAHGPSRQPMPAKRALSEVVTSFLADHNIRWGELVAGLMIVVCSIGLVVSLWSTITSKHRVVPSLIFMSADAAIFAAGLYTMRRWKLRHTSRAVLIIATLLVPLCVLAGLAAAGASIDTVSLASPVTLAAIVIGTAVCGWLMWQASLALVGRGGAVSLTTSVVVPTLCLPLLPAAGRLLGVSAGSFVIVPAIVTAITLVMPTRRHFRLRGGEADRMMKVGQRFWKNHWLHLGVAIASLASVVVYAAFLYQADGRAAWIQIAIATVPVWVSLAMVHGGFARILANQSKWATPRFICVVIGVIAVGCSLAITPASIEQVRWLWAHALAMSVAMAVVGALLYRRPRLAEASVPVGVAAMLSSPFWLAGEAWSDVPVWRAFMGGEPLLVAITIAALGAVIGLVLSRKRGDTGATAVQPSMVRMAIVPALWGSVAGVQAMVLSIAPASWLGMLPVWGLACVLFAAMVSAAVAAVGKPILAWVSAIAGTCFWITCLGLVRWSEGQPVVDYESLSLGLLGLSGSMLALAIGGKLGWGEKSLVAVGRFVEVSAASACGVVGWLATQAALGFASESIVSPQWGTSGWMIAAASGLLAIGAIFVRQRRYLQIAMFVSAAAIYCGVTHYGRVELWFSPAWRSGDALWNLAGVTVAAAMLWLLIREAARFVPDRFDNPLTADPAWSRRTMPDGWMLLVALGLLVVAVVWRYVAILTGPLGTPLDRWFVVDSELDVRALGRLALLACLGGGVWLSQFREPSRSMHRVLGAVGAISGLLLAMAISAYLTELPSLRLIATTTLACGGVIAAWGISRWITRRDVESPNTSLEDRVVGAGVVGVLVSLGSAVLLSSNWWKPLSEGLPPDRWSTLAVASWWVAASLALLFSNRLFGERGEVDDAGPGLAGSNASEQGDVLVTGAMGRAVDASRVLSALLLPAAIGISVPVFYATEEVVWWQASALGSVLWLAIAWLGNRSGVGTSGEPDVDQGAALSRGWIGAVGLLSAGMVLAGLMSESAWTISWSLPLGPIVSMLALAVCCRETSLGSSQWGISRLSVVRVVPFVLPVMSGHLACLAIAMGWIAVADSLLVVMACGLLGSFASAVLVWRGFAQLQAWHVSVQAVLLFVIAFLCLDGAFDVAVGYEGWVSWLGFAGQVIGAVALMRFAVADVSAGTFRPIAVLPRTLGWFVVLAGAFLLATHPDIPSGDLVQMTCVFGWIGACTVLWRSDRLTVHGYAQVARADLGVSTLLVLLLLASVFMLDVNMRWRGVGATNLSSVMGGFQFVIAWGVAASAWLRPALASTRPVSMWTVSMWLIAAGSAVLAKSLSRVWQVESDVSWVIAILAATSSMSVMVWGLGSLERLRSRLEAMVVRGPVVDRLGTAVERVVIGLVFFGTLVSVGLVLSEADANWVRLSVLAIGISAWSLFQLAEQTQPTISDAAMRRRNGCVSVGLWTLGLIAVLGQPDASEWALTATMRLLIASVLAIGVILLMVPRLLGGAFLARWQQALRRGGILSAGVAAVSLVIMLGIEMVVRSSAMGIPGIAMPLVVVVAIILGGLALMAGVVAVLSGPAVGQPLAGMAGQKNWLHLDDSRRRQLLYAAQAIAALTWLHLFLCRSSIAFLGLRQVWPYIVMLIAFASIGLTQWAIRRGDAVLSETMRRTAMFLPMIPIVGFWLSGSYASMLHSQDWSWTFYRGTTSYQGLLVVGAIYYGVMSAMWKRGLPRVATVVLANGALWVMLTQMPGWDFLTHPQAWLIPPAVCVLAVAYWQRDQLDPTVGSAIRYGATLVIYLSSTADMLMSEIGSSLWGPVILVLLSLAGMLAGVMLRIKPFLYLGAIFIFMGVTSMVWHATQSIDAVWPWWVFGITTGLLLLSALAGIEKHRGRLQQWSDELAKWEN